MYATFVFSEAGGHIDNEDAFVVEPHPADPSCRLCVLADGMGGQSGGGEAARLACRTALARALTVPVSALADPVAWTTLLRHADEAVRQDPSAGFTTLLGFAVTAATVAGASCGDSAVWLAQDGRVQDLTHHQVKHPPVGSGAAPFVPFAARLREPWLLLAMSDGVWKYVSPEKARDLVLNRRGQDLINGLQSLARLPGSGRFSDDFTAVVLQAP
jgi:serine/threonine protein phosphatase PrpC